MWKQNYFLFSIHFLAEYLTCSGFEYKESFESTVIDSDWIKHTAHFQSLNYVYYMIKILN